MGRRPEAGSNPVHGPGYTVCGQKPTQSVNTVISAVRNPWVKRLPRVGQNLLAHKQATKQPATAITLRGEVGGDCGASTHGEVDDDRAASPRGEVDARR
jgi:hypothetical protein